MSEREIPTSEVAVRAGVPVYTIRKWKRRGDLPLAPKGRHGQGAGNECFWSPEAVREVLNRAAEHRGHGYRRPSK